ncbi:uncharacterized protein LOC133737482 [Rosa rugosa]|uniref:uncharacterized protein LOC133737482 n=1 Tax=Rosa rugosa TaxID=74645 RepID=UPI002B41724E|nr:uncharacterized protein LOC133737482 [Rosa rugosa]
MLVWHFTKNGQYNVKSGYWVAVELQNRNRVEQGGTSMDRTSGLTARIWKSVWGLAIPHKVKVFLWRACRDFLPCAYKLVLRKISNDSSCWQCRCRVESVLHVLWEYPYARRVWKLSFLSEVCKVWKEPSFIDLFSHVNSITCGTDLEEFGFLAWWLWRNRNLHRHGEKYLTPSELVMAARSWKTKFELANRRIDGASQSGQCNQVDWQPPKQSFIKLNFDAACDEKRGCVGLGVVFRDEVGSLRGALDVPQVGRLKPRAAEALALLHGLKFVVHVGFNKLKIEGDVLTIINTLHDSSEDLSEEGNVLEEAKEVMRQLTQYSWGHVRRDCNRVAHKVAKEALQLGEPMLCLQSGPSWLHNYVEMDVSHN